MRDLLSVFAAAVLGTGSILSAQTLPVPVSSTFHAGTSSIDLPGVGPRTFTSYNGLFRSPSGSRWMYVANFSGDSASNRAVIAGATSPGGATSQIVVARKGGAIPGSARTLNIVDDGRINDAGQFVFDSNSSGAAGTTPTIFQFTGSVEPSPTYAVAGAVGQEIPFAFGATYAGGFQTNLIDNTGRPGSACSMLDGGLTYRCVLFGTSVVSRSSDGAFAPTLLPGTLAANWADYLLQRVFVDATGANFFWLGTVDGPIDTAALNNVAVAQEGSLLPGTTDTLGTLFGGWYEPGGAWFIRGTLSDTTTDIVVRNGSIIARRNDPVVPGSTIVWDRVTAGSTSNGFLFNVGNDGSDYVVCGNTLDTANSARTAAVVLNGRTIVIRRGDPVDLNGNGIADDNARIRGFKSEIGPGTAFLTNSGELWMVVDVENDAGTDLGDAIVRMRVPLCRADFNGVGGVTVQDIFDFLAAYFASDPAADFNNSGDVTVQDIFDYLAAYFAGCD